MNPCKMATCQHAHSASGYSPGMVVCIVMPIKAESLNKPQWNLQDIVTGDNGVCINFKEKEAEK